MVNIGTLIICCLGSLFIGSEIAWYHASQNYKRHLDDMKEFYEKNTMSLTRSILKCLGKYEKGGEG
jgi:hypothetical protein